MLVIKTQKKQRNSQCLLESAFAVEQTHFLSLTKSIAVSWSRRNITHTNQPIKQRWTMRLSLTTQHQLAANTLTTISAISTACTSAQRLDFVVKISNTVISKKLCYGRGTARRACQYRKACNRRMTLTYTQVITVAGIKWPYGISLVALAQWKNVGLWPAVFPCPAPDLQLTGDHSRG